MFAKEMTDEEKLEHCYGHIVRNRENFLFTEDGLRVLQYLRQHPYASEDVQRAMEAMYLHIVGL